MLGIIVTSYSALPNCIHHDYMLSELGDNYKVAYLTTWQNKEFVEELSDNLKNPIYYLSDENDNILNPGHHDGVFYMCSSVIEEFKDCDYILHFHADNFLRDGIKTIKDTYTLAKNNNLKVLGLPRQWLFDDNTFEVMDKSIPFHFEYCMMKYSVWKNAFNLERLNEYKHLALNNDHPSQQFEPCLYQGLVVNGIDINKDIYYLESIDELKNRFGNEPVYYNFFFKNSGIFHYDETSLKNNVKK